MRQCERVAGSESHPWDRKRMVAGSEGRGRAGTLGVGLLMVSVTLVSANSPPRFLLETNVGSEIVLRLREGPRQQNNSILRSVQSVAYRLSGEIITYSTLFFTQHFDLLTVTISTDLGEFSDRTDFC